MSTIPVSLTAEELSSLQRTIERLDALKAQERITKRAPYELFVLEEGLGDYEWLVRRIVEWEP